MTIEPGRYDHLDPEAAGQRIGELLDELERELSADRWVVVSELTGLLTSVHGAAIERILAIAAADPLGERLVDTFVEDPLVKSLLIVHGLVPDDDVDMENQPVPVVSQPVTLLPRRPRP